MMDYVIWAPHAEACTIQWVDLHSLLIVLKKGNICAKQASANTVVNRDWTCHKLQEEGGKISVWTTEEKAFKVHQRHAQDKPIHYTTKCTQKQEDCQVEETKLQRSSK